LAAQACRFAEAALCQAWRSAFQLRLADRFREAHLLEGALGVWQLSLARRRKLADAEEQFVAGRRFSLASLAFSRWLQSSRLSIAEREHRAGADMRVLQGAWATWRRGR
jgi:hypothetical protein